MVISMNRSTIAFGVVGRIEQIDTMHLFLEYHGEVDLCRPRY